MLFPSISHYKEAIALSESFATLTYLTPEKGLFGDVYFSSGNFATVFKMRDSRTGKLHAVKCFTREQERRTESLGQISAYLETLQSPFIVPYTFLNDEIWVNDAEYPVLLMDWVEGVTLGEKVKTLCEEASLRGIEATEGLHRLSVAFADMALALLAQDWAHGDLKHDNIIVRSDNTLALVDYDGCFVPSMSGQNAREIGSPCYRHPKRTAQHFDRHIDDFSILVIFLSLRALVNAPELLTQHHNGENMVLTTADFGNAAPLLTALRDKNEPILRGCVALLEFALAMPSGQVFGLKEGVLMPFFEEFKKDLLSKKVILKCETKYWRGVKREVIFEEVIFEIDRNAIHLDLSSKHIVGLPAKIGQLTNLTSLRLGGNLLTHLPAEIGKLTNLESLYLLYNNRISLPVEISQLANLTHLSLAHNQLTSLPKEIWQLSNLTHLSLAHNQLTSLPKEIGQLTNLIKLNLWGNKLPSLPKEIGQLGNLTELTLYDNELTSLPKEIGQLSNLTELILEYNQLTSLPKEIGQLTKLTRLSFRMHNFLEVEAEKIKQLLPNCEIIGYRFSD